MGEYMEELEYLFNYQIRVAGIILKKDPDNKENRMLTVAEGKSSKFALPGGKLPIALMKNTKERLDFLINKMKFDIDSLFEDYEKFEIHKKEIIEPIHNEELINGLESELFEEIGLTTNKDALTHIENIKLYSLYFEKFYSKSILVSPIYKVDINRPDRITYMLNEKINKGETEITEPKWASALEVLSPEYHETFQHSVFYIGRQLQEDHLLNGIKKENNLIKKINS